MAILFLKESSVRGTRWSMGYPAFCFKVVLKYFTNIQLVINYKNFHKPSKLPCQ